LVQAAVTQVSLGTILQAWHAFIFEVSPILLGGIEAEPG